MRIYIDEAGNFAPQASGQSLFSLVLAFVVPSSIETKLFGEFSALLSSWPNSGTEIKGSKLDEPQAAQLLELASATTSSSNSSPSIWQHTARAL